jgi:hypothetical protein
MVLGASRPGGGAFRGGGLGYFPSYDDYGCADFGNYADDGACLQYGGAAPDRSTASK